MSRTSICGQVDLGAEQEVSKKHLGQFPAGALKDKEFPVPFPKAWLGTMEGQWGFLKNYQGTTKFDSCSYSSLI
jgi:hypothetical protein